MYTMGPEALMSRLRARCQFTEVEWSESDTSRTLARRLIRDAPEAFEQWKREYEMAFIEETGTFVDLRDSAYALVALDIVDEVLGD